jgi:hypothetical protein
MSAPSICPHCGTESIEPTFQYATLSVPFDGIPCTISGLHAYRCNNAHYFIVFGSQAALGEAGAQRAGRGSSLFL